MFISPKMAGISIGISIFSLVHFFLIGRVLFDDTSEVEIRPDDINVLEDSFDDELILD